MLAPLLIERLRKWTAYVTAVLGFLLFGAALLSYLNHDYWNFISDYASREGWHGKDVLKVFVASGLRSTLRMAYVISFVRLLFLQRGAVYLCLIAWVGQLVPSAIFFYFNGNGIDAGHVYSLAGLLLYIGLVGWFWPTLKADRSWTFCAAGLLAGILVHSLLFFCAFDYSTDARPTSDWEEQGSLLQAVQDGDTEKVRALLADKNFFPKFRGDHCDANTICYLVSYAVMDKGNAEIVRLLRAAGSPIDEPDGGTGDTPIMRAMLAGHIDAAEYLATEGIDPLRTNRFGVRELIVASGEGSPTILEAMLKRGAPVDLRQKLPDPLATASATEIVGGITPLMVAAAFGRIDLIKTLLDHGANPALVDEKGRNVYTYTMFGKDPKIETRLTALIKSKTPDE